MDIHPHGLVAIGRPSLTQLSRSLLGEVPEQAPRYLQEMGYAAGEALFSAFSSWLRDETGVSHPAELAAEALGPTLSGFLVQAGWGPVTIEQLSDAVLAVDASDAPEADAGAGHQAPSCYVMSGMLADLLGRVSGATVAVMEVECRALLAERCRFLVGGPETLERVYDYVAQGGAYLEAVR